MELDALGPYVHRLVRQLLLEYQPEQLEHQPEQLELALNAIADAAGDRVSQLGEHTSAAVSSSTKEVLGSSNPYGAITEAIRFLEFLRWRASGHLPRTALSSGLANALRRERRSLALRGMLRGADGDASARWTWLAQHGARLVSIPFIVLDPLEPSHGFVTEVLIARFGEKARQSMPRGMGRIVGNSNLYLGGADLRDPTAPDWSVLARIELEMRPRFGKAPWWLALLVDAVADLPSGASIDGDSFTIAVAMGMLAAKRGARIPPGLVAAGAVSDNLEVSELDEHVFRDKLAVARREGYAPVLYATPSHKSSAIGEQAGVVPIGGIGDLSKYVGTLVPRWRRPAVSMVAAGALVPVVALTVVYYNGRLVERQRREDASMAAHALLEACGPRGEMAPERCLREAKRMAARESGAEVDWPLRAAVLTAAGRIPRIVGRVDGSATFQAVNESRTRAAYLRGGPSGVALQTEERWEIVEVDVSGTPTFRRIPLGDPPSDRGGVMGFAYSNDSTLQFLRLSDSEYRLIEVRQGGVPQVVHRYPVPRFPPRCLDFFAPRVLNDGRLLFVGTASVAGSGNPVASDCVAVATDSGATLAVGPGSATVAATAADGALVVRPIDSSAPVARVGATTPDGLRLLTLPPRVRNGDCSVVMHDRLACAYEDRLFVLPFSNFGNATVEIDLSPIGCDSGARLANTLISSEGGVFAAVLRLSTSADEPEDPMRFCVVAYDFRERDRITRLWSRRSPCNRPVINASGFSCSSFLEDGTDSWNLEKLGAVGSAVMLAGNRAAVGLESGVAVLDLLRPDKVLEAVDPSTPTLYPSNSRPPYVVFAPAANAARAWVLESDGVSLFERQSVRPPEKVEAVTGPFRGFVASPSGESAFLRFPEGVTLLAMRDGQISASKVNVSCISRARVSWTGEQSTVLLEDGSSGFLPPATSILSLGDDLPIGRALQPVSLGPNQRLLGASGDRLYGVELTDGSGPRLRGIVLSIRENFSQLPGPDTECELPTWYSQRHLMVAPSMVAESPDGQTFLFGTQRCAWLRRAGSSVFTRVTLPDWGLQQSEDLDQRDVKLLESRGGNCSLAPSPNAAFLSRDGSYLVSDIMSYWPCVAELRAGAYDDLGCMGTGGWTNVFPSPKGHVTFDGSSIHVFDQSARHFAGTMPPGDRLGFERWIDSYLGPSPAAVQPDGAFAPEPWVRVAHRALESVK